MSARARVWAFAAVLFALGNGTGFACARAVGISQLERLFRPDGLARHRILQRVLTKQLRLDPRQQARLEEILTRQDPAYLAILREREPKLVELREEIVRELGPSLNETQVARLRELVAEANLHAP